MSEPIEDRASERLLRLHFEGRLTHGHTLPASALVKSLQQLQRVVHLVALAKSGRSLRQRARTTHEIERRYPILCHIPEEGGYALPVEIGDQINELFDDPAVEIANVTRSVIVAISNGDEHQLAQIVPDHSFRRSVLSAFQSMQPAKRTGLIVHIEDYRGAKLLDGNTASKSIATMIESMSDGSATAPGYVVGALIAMEFQNRRLSLQLLGSGRVLDATYRDDFEPVLLDHPRDLVQIHGNVLYDSTGHATSVSDVDFAIDVDDTEIEIVDLQIGNDRLVPSSRLKFDVKFNQESSLFEAEGPFGIISAAETRGELVEAVDAEILMLWGEYAQSDGSNLTDDAMILRTEMLSAFRLENAD